MQPEFGVYDHTTETATTQRNLPHWFQPDVATFVTFRTADSLPRKVVLAWNEELSALEKELKASHQFSATQIARRVGHLRGRLAQKSLDNCHGACVLRRQELSQVVADALLHFDGDRYDLDSFVVMPNHVHVLLQFRSTVQLSKQTSSWLRFSGRLINQHLEQKGEFWQSERFDHLVRSVEQFEYIRACIAANPKKAKLRSVDCRYWSRCDHSVPRLSES